MNAPLGNPNFCPMRKPIDIDMNANFSSIGTLFYLICISYERWKRSANI